MKAELTLALDLFRDLPHLTSRTMTGATCLYSDGQIFSVVGDGEIYLRARGTLGDDLAASGARQFKVTRDDGSTGTNCYWTLPAEALDDAALACDWARRSIDASRAEIETKKKRKQVG